MVPAPGSSPPLSPTSTSSSPSRSAPPSKDYANIVRSLQRRSAERLADEHSASSWRLKGSTGAGGVSQDLEADLKLAAQIGQTLLEEKMALTQRLKSVEKGNQKLLDRLTASVKENAQLQRRLEEAVGNLEQADASNRALLVSLETDRKTISRLSVDSGKLVAASATLKSLQRTHEDTQQELAAERKRAAAAEAKMRKQGERVGELEERLKKAIQDLEEMRQDKVLRSRKSHDALAKVRARYGRAGGAGQTEVPPLPGTEGLSENTEAKELLKLVENLVTENNMLRSESMELHGLLESSRDEQVDLRSAMANQEIFPEEDEEDVRRAEDDDVPPPVDRRRFSTLSTNSAPPFHSESIVSPSLSQAGFDFDPHRPPLSPASIHALSYNRYWSTSTSLSHSQRAADLSRTVSIGSTASGEEQATFASQAGAGAQRSGSLRRRPPPVSSSSTSALSGGKIPVGRRGHSRRAMSVDVSMVARGVCAPCHHPQTLANNFILQPLPPIDPGSAPVSPRFDYSPSKRPPSIFSNASEEPEPFVRPRRHHRPLSLSLGPSLFPDVPENESPRARSHSRRGSQATFHPSPSAGDSLASAPSGFSLSSPTKRLRTRSSNSPDGERRVVVKVDSSTQTTPPSTPSRPTYPHLPHLSHPYSTTSTPQRSPHSLSLSRSPSPHPGPAPSQTSVSDLSDDRLLEPNSSPGGSGNGVIEQRTLALGQLIEHVAKLLGRLQGADIATQEKRLKKQNLPGGDVKHLAQANLRDLVTDIDSMRNHFRRVLEQERASLAKEAPASPHTSTESLVSRRDFVSLVKLLRDLLFEASRLRSLVNRVHLEPVLASQLNELDDPKATAVDLDRPGASKSAGTAGGLLAPLSRLFGSSLSPDEHPTLTSRASSAQLRAPLKRGGSSAITSATVNVDFGKAGVRASSIEPTVSRTATPPPQRSPAPSPSIAKRDLSSIFAGSTSRAGPVAEPWVVLPSATTLAKPSLASSLPPPPSQAQPAPKPSLAATASSYLPFGRLLSSYRPALSATTDAVLDSLPHALPRGSPLASSTAIEDPPPTLLERQLRPRGLSDSSIRSSFLSHGVGANPHHRILTPATLALSSEPARIQVPVVVADSSSALSSSSMAASPASAGAGGAIDALRQQLDADESLLSTSGASGGGDGGGGAISRRASAANLRARASQSRLREQILSRPGPSSAATDSTLSLPTSPATAAAAPPSAVASSLSTSPAAPIHISPPSPLKSRTPHHHHLSASQRSSASPQSHSSPSPPLHHGPNSSSLFGTLSGWNSGWGSDGGAGAASAAGGGGGASRHAYAGGGLPESYKERSRLGREG
ncbi:hypothetical protein JCM1840_002165 [Sporobolomyces johnsonii]